MILQKAGHLLITTGQRYGELESSLTAFCR